jgi:hypothetical protein
MFIHSTARVADPCSGSHTLKPGERWIIASLLYLCTHLWKWGRPFVMVTDQSDCHTPPFPLRPVLMFSAVPHFSNREIQTTQETKFQHKWRQKFMQTETLWIVSCASKRMQVSKGHCATLPCQQIIVHPSADVCHRHVLTAQWRLWLCGDQDRLEHSKTPHRKCWTLAKFLCGEPFLIILKSLSWSRNWQICKTKKFSTIVIPNSLALDAVLNHTNLQTVSFFYRRTPRRRADYTIAAQRRNRLCCHLDSAQSGDKKVLCIFSFHSVNRFRQLTKHVNQTIKHNSDISVECLTTLTNQCVPTYQRVVIIRRVCHQNADWLHATEGPMLILSVWHQTF